MTIKIAEKSEKCDKSLLRVLLAPIRRVIFIFMIYIQLSVLL